MMKLAFAIMLLPSWVCAETDRPASSNALLRERDRQRLEKLTCSDSSSLQSFQEYLAEGFDSPSFFEPKAQPLFTAFWEKCNTKLNERQSECFRNMRNFLKSKRDWEKKTHSIGLEISDREMAAKAESRFPDMLTLPKYLAKLPPHWRQEINDCKEGKRQGGMCDVTQSWEVIEYESLDCHQGNGKNILFKVPGKEFDRWIVIRENSNGRPQMITLQKVDDSLKPLSQPIPYWSMFTNGSRDPHNSGQACIKCHGGGLNLVRPIPGTVRSIGGSTIASINKTISAQGPIDNDGMVRREHRGPPVGGKSCLSCHGENDWDVRSSVFSEDRARFRVEIDLTMPPRHPDHPYAKLLERLDDMSGVSPEVQAKIAKLYRGTSEIETIGTRCLPEGMKRARLGHLDLLKESGVLNEAKHRELTETLQKLFIENKAIAEEGSRQQTSFKEWIRGGKSCLTEGLLATPPDTPVAR